MKHPFINDLSDKSLEDLQSTVASLSTKLSFAYRTGNSSMIQQLLMALDSYKSEYNKKMDELMGKQNLKINIQKES